MIPVLILARPLDLYTGQRVEIRLGSAADGTALGLGGQPWEPALARRPRIAQDLMSKDLDGRFKLAAADFVVSMNLLSRIRDVNRLHFPGAPVIIYRATDLTMSQIPVEFSGIVSTAPFDLDTRRLTVNATVDRTRIDKPLLTREFGGGGGADGEAAVRGVLKPAGFGYNESIEWVLFDTVNNIGMLDGYGNLTQVHRALEGLNDLGPSVGDYPTYAALVTALRNKTIVPGRWGTCLAEGMVGLGAPPVGRITFVASFGLNRSGAIMARVLRTHAGVDEASIDAAAFALLDTSVNREVRYHTTSQVQVSDLIEAMALPINATPLITAQNLIAITRVTLSAPVATLRRGGTNPTVTDWRTAEPIEPVYRMVYRVARPGVVLSTDEVNYSDSLIDRGLYSPTEVYRAGNLVWLADKSQWLYQNATPSAGHAPPSGAAADGAGNVSDAWWFRRQRPASAVDLTYASGETIESLKPRQAGADVTGDNTAHDTSFIGGIPTQEVLDTIEAVISDGILSPPEKNVAITQFDELKSRVKALNDRFIVLGSPADIAPYRDAAVSALNRLDTYLHVTLKPSIDVVSADTPIDGLTYRQNWRDALSAINEYTAAVTGRPGKDGRNGTDGAPGARGADGRTSYVHYAYANSPDGRIDFDLNQPNGRAYEGSYTDFTAADSNDPAAYVWREYKGPPFGMASRGDAIVAGNSVVKYSTGSVAWDADAFSTVGFRNGCIVSFTGTGNQDVMAGLNTDPTADSSFTSLDYAWYLRSDGAADIYESGARVRQDLYPGYGKGIFQVEYTGKLIRYTYNGIMVREVPVAADILFYFDSSINTPGGRIENISFVPRGANGTDGRDGVNGTNGINGRDGVNGGSAYFHVAYANSADGSVDFTTGAPGARTYLGVAVDQNAADPETFGSYAWSLIKGRDGLNGNDGTPGARGADGRQSYVHFAYSNSADGSVAFSTDDPSGRAYIGVYSDFTVADSGDYRAYTWSLAKGADGAQGPSGPQGPKGADGINGLQNTGESQAFLNYGAGNAGFVQIAAFPIYVAPASKSLTVIADLVTQRGAVAGSSTGRFIAEAVLPNGTVYQLFDITSTTMSTTISGDESIGGDGSARSVGGVSSLPLPFADFTRVLFRLSLQRNTLSGNPTSITTSGIYRVELR